jgi:hypothetical protein
VVIYYFKYNRCGHLIQRRTDMKHDMSCWIERDVTNSCRKEHGVRIYARYMRTHKTTHVTSHRLLHGCAAEKPELNANKWPETWEAVRLRTNSRIFFIFFLPLSFYDEFMGSCRFFPAWPLLWIQEQTKSTSFIYEGAHHFSPLEQVILFGW